ncbi:tetratricopeptide repeat-containing sensor histidine kinase [Chryseobacterium populi]|uniref:histidine kinase n=1 Tax=Chryseobacterium populi TaxID=1144316 RepID=J2TC96_9FLAO|nr:sensor histidine kinase [Chryseobacterium populi]EJL75812.1 histidine kinase [Chryseobacterium populi]
MEIRRYILLSWFTLSFFCNASAQLNNLSVEAGMDNAAYPDNLKSKLQNTASDSTKARLYFLLSEYWADKDTLTSKAYLLHGRKLSETNYYLQALSSYYYGVYYFHINQEKSEQAFFISRKSLLHYKTKEAYLYMANCYANYAYLQYRKDKSQLMADLLLNKSIPLIKKAGNNELLGKFYGDIGLVFKNRWQYNKAEKYFVQSIYVLEKTKIKHPSRLLFVYALASENYLFEGKKNEAKKLLDKASPLLDDILPGLSHVGYYFSESLYFEVTNQYEKALSSIDKGLNLAFKLIDKYYIEKLSFLKYKILTRQGKYLEAKNLLENIIKTSTTSYSQNRQTQYYELAETYHRLGNEKKAYAWLKKLLILKDSLNRQQIDNQINQLEIKYQTSEKEKKIAALNAETKQATLIIKNNKLYNWLLLFVCLFLFTVVGLLWVYYKNYKKLIQQKVTALEQQQHIALTSAILEAEESERNRVAKDLHDGLGGILTAVKINLANFTKESHPDAKNLILQDIRNQLDHSITELRYIAKNMMPQTLLQYGLETAIKELCESIIHNNLIISFEAINIGETIPLNKQLIIYRILQEILTNILKHSYASEVVLQCSQNQNRFYITAEDNGKGFDLSKVSNKIGLGINNIKNRVEHLGGKIEILSAPDEGTSINIELDV